MASFAITQLIVVIALLYTYQAPRALCDTLTSRPSIASELNISGERFASFLSEILVVLVVLVALSYKVLAMRMI